MFGAPRQLMLENDYVQQGAYKAGGPYTHMGKIKYPQVGERLRLERQKYPLTTLA